jgi:hypothetical protein
MRTKEGRAAVGKSVASLGLAGRPELSQVLVVEPSSGLLLATAARRERFVAYWAGALSVEAR